MEDFNYLTGNLTIGYILAAFVFLFIGIAIVKSIRLMNRKKGGVRKEKLSFKYWLEDNYLGLIVHALTAVVTIRFTSQFVELLGDKIDVLIGTSSDPMYIYLLFRLMFQTILDLIQKITR